MLRRNTSKRLVLALVSSQTGPTSGRTIAELLGRTTQYTKYRKHLLTLWREGKLTRSTKEYNSQYYYLPTTTKTTTLLGKQSVMFVPHENNSEGRTFKHRILTALDANGPLNVRQMCSSLQQIFDGTFQRKINFHLQDLFKQKKVRRTQTHPIYYYTNPQHALQLSKKTYSIPATITSILQNENTSFFSEELLERLKQQHISAKASAVSLALRRLAQQGKIISSRTKFGARSAQCGFLYAMNREAITSRFIKTISAECQELISHNTISSSELKSALGKSDVITHMFAQRLAQEIPEFELATDSNIPHTFTLIRKAHNA